MNVRRSTAAAAVALGLPALSLGLSGCGFDAPTDQAYNPAAGVNVQEGEVDVLNAIIVSGEDGTGTVVVTLANNNQDADDALAGVTGEGVQAEVGGDTVIPAHGILVIDDGLLSVTGESVVPGAFVPLTFEFDRARSLSLDVPVVASDEPPYDEVPVS
ncbi:MAG TPA: hypothetical protein VFH10_13725 [Nocardioides sp.]|uniref:hypothetical protein n=1 Tax=Nocardioides sp. TaxID=35761 RepID=UPI002D80AA94|nr:hypothetical protein [Nocardioides sp.]HET6653698.1 hypothetical protein [Nocardioides sp.]